MTGHKKYNKSMCAIAEKVLAEGESLAAICADLNICRATLYEWRETYPEFKQAIDRGLQKAQREWEKIGTNGAKGLYEKFSAPTWIFTMKNRFRDDYRDDKEVKTNNDVNIVYMNTLDNLKEE
jgi:hypothetical protein